MTNRPRAQRPQLRAPRPQRPQCSEPAQSRASKRSTCWLAALGHSTTTRAHHPQAGLRPKPGLCAAFSIDSHTNRPSRPRTEKVIEAMPRFEGENRSPRTQIARPASETRTRCPPQISDIKMLCQQNNRCPRARRTPLAFDLSCPDRPCHHRQGASRGGPSEKALRLCRDKQLADRQDRHGSRLPGTR